MKGDRHMRRSLRGEVEHQHLEIILCEFLLENDRCPGSAELAKQLGVTPRTVRTYLKERREWLCGPEKVWLHLYEDGKPIGEPELLTIEECARRVGITVRELRRRAKANQPAPSSDKT